MTSPWFARRMIHISCFIVACGVPIFSFCSCCQLDVTTTTTVAATSSLVLASLNSTPSSLTTSQHRNGMSLSNVRCNSTKLGDGICDEGTILNTEECNWDEGDCILSKYPECRVRFPSKIGNGICDTEYNTLACGYDGGDCQDDILNAGSASSGIKRRSAGQVAGIVMGSMAIFALVLFSQWLFVQSRNQYSNLGRGTTMRHPDNATEMSVNPNLTSFSNHIRRMTPTAALFSWGLTRNSIRFDKEKREARIRLVRKSIICKKVLPLLSDKAATSSSVVDCHLSTGSYHSLISKGNYDETNTDDNYDVVGGDVIQDMHRRTNHRKDHIYIDCCSTHPSVSTIHSLRHGMKVASSHHSLYSPRCCPICYEEYKIGEDIAWSQNDECPHVYHLNCILEWLLDNDVCPMCRAQYINIDMVVEEEDDEQEELSPTMVMQEFPISIPIHVPMGSENENRDDLNDEEEMEASGG